LLEFGPVEKASFEFAAAHWILSIVEDHMVGPEIYKSASNNQNNGIYLFFYCGLICHHIFAIFAYCWCLWTHELSGLCVLGLIFEFPVIILNLREIYFSVLYPDEPWSKLAVFQYWSALHAAWHSTRTLSCLCYLFSLLVWMKRTRELLSRTSFIVYNILGGGFTYINLVLLCTVIPLYTMADISRAALAREGGEEGKFLGPSSSFPTGICSSNLTTEG
jgi:hypothetical protein